MGTHARELLPDDFRLFRSPWFDHQCEERNHDPVAVGQELQIEYLTSGSPRFSTEDLVIVSRTVREPIERRKVDFIDGQLSIRVQDYGELLIFERPQARNSYVLAIDPSSGNANKSTQGNKVVTSQAGVMVLNTTLYPASISLCAYYQSRVLDPGWIAKLSSTLGKEYNNAMMIFEVTGLGQAVLVTLIGSGQSKPMYSRFYYQKRAKPDERGRNYRIGWWNNNNTRPLLEQAIADNLRTVQVNDSRVAEQLNAFVWAFSGQELQGRAQEGFNDDAVMTLGMALLGAEQCHGYVQADGQPERDWSEVLDNYRLGGLSFEQVISQFTSLIRRKE